MPERVPFLEIFNEYPDGSLSPRVPIEVNGALFKPGVVFQKGVIFGGVDFQLYKYRDIAFQRKANDTYQNIHQIVGFY